MDAEELYERLRPIQEKKGYYFANDRKFVMGLLESLLTNKSRYGYMACPCRLKHVSPLMKLGLFLDKSVFVKVS